MPKRRLLYQLYPSYLLITLAALVGVGWFAARLSERFLLDDLHAELEGRARYLEGILEAGGTEMGAESRAAACCEVAQAAGIRLTLLAADGTVLADSEKPVAELQGLAERPEVVQARAGQVAGAARIDPALGEREYYLALPLKRGAAVVGIIHASKSIAHVDRALATIELRIALVGLVIAALGAVVSYWVARRISQPIEVMRQGAQRFARGDLDYKLSPPESEELAGLAEALNLMASQLQERINVIVRQSNEQRAVVSSMAEGVLAVDNQERIISLNKASCQLLGIDSSQAQGRSLQEVLRNADLRRFVSRVLRAHDTIDDDVVLHGNHEGVLQARGAALHDAQGRAIGAVVVLNDVTEFRRLEHIRRDFVANVSHELKTPITSIKGFVETLLDGAMHDPDETERFLRIVVKQADRLNAIIEDLLSLSRVEQGEESSDILLEHRSLEDVLLSAVHECETRARDRDIHVRVACEPDVLANLNGPLFEQAVINLLDNAIKYSEPGREVQVLGGQSDGEVTITVADQGSGISAEHLPRIFERFYRVDKARSRKLGGTGLGLAIVKHIVQAHGGRVSVRSSLGQGSAFTIHLPRPIPAPLPTSLTH